MIYPPSNLTWRRWWMLVNCPQMTLLRILEYERIQRICLEGMSLDVGGGKASSYNHLISIQGKIHTLNINLAMGPTYIADLNYGLPVATSSYDNIISFNTLEHIWQDVFVLQEMFRVLKPGGNLYLLVPFLYRVHASPGDYHRHTGYFWAEMLTNIGFKSIEVEPLNFGPLAAPLSLIEFIFPPCIRRIVRAGVLLVSILWVKLRPKGVRSSGSDTPLGYFIKARK